MVTTAKCVIDFVEVGRSIRSWTSQAMAPSDEAILAEIRRRGGLASRDVDIEWNDDGAGGVILVGGFRQVGTFRVRDEA
jgi:hypothetical protein